MAPTPDRRWPGALALGLALALAGPAAAEPGTVIKPTELRAQPLGSAEVLAKLAAQEAVEITARQGAWAGVTTGEGQQGWARILNLRTGAGQGNAGGSDQLAAVFKTGSRGSSVATAVKGLSADELMSASANHAEVALLDEYAASAGEASKSCRASDSSTRSNRCSTVTSTCPPGGENDTALSSRFSSTRTSRAGSPGTSHGPVSTGVTVTRHAPLPPRSIRARTSPSANASRSTGTNWVRLSSASIRLASAISVTSRSIRRTSCAAIAVSSRRSCASSTFSSVSSALRRLASGFLISCATSAANCSLASMRS